MAKFPGNPKRFGRNHKYRHMWKFPYGRKAQRSPGFKRFCWNHGYVSPHFSRQEWASKDGTPVPSSLRKNAQRQAFKCERLRHRLGDRPLAGLSYYRSPAHNRAVGGASQSRHMSADATDWPAHICTAQFRAAASEIWRNNGIGSYPGGNVHTDARPWYARWTSW